ncbi:MAG: hypothetical protein WBN13_12185 [Robiginitalea sp.]
MLLNRLFSHLKKSWYSYLLEVIVVVLGILIALALDNWNEDRKLAETEVLALKEIDQGLQRLMWEVESNLEEEKTARSSGEFILRNFENRGGVTDSLQTALTKVWFYTYIQPDYGPYEYVNTYGASVIQNVTLREKILELYGLDVRATVGESNIRGRYIEDLRLQMGQWYTSWNANPYRLVPTQPRDYKKLREDPIFRYHLNSQLSESTRWIAELSGLRLVISELRNEVAEEIHRRD